MFCCNIHIYIFITYAILYCVILYIDNTGKYTMVTIVLRCYKNIVLQLADVDLFDSLSTLYS